MLEAVTSLIASVQDAEPHHKFPDDKLPVMVSSFLHNDLNPPPINSLCPMSPPIFPRPLETASVRGMENLSDIRSLGFAVPVKADCEELESPSKAHMLLIDGWRQFNGIPKLTPLNAFISTTFRCLATTS